MKKYMMAAGALLVSACMYAQKVEQSPFAAPFDFPLYLSGNFGELRANHFHGGIDFKTQGAEGKPVATIADGYISRVTVSAGGYGKAVYITHPDGYLSVYGHLKAFLPAVAQRVEQYQYENETFQADLSFAPGEFPVKRGSRIAWSGNTGYSFGPHLHMEIRKADTGEYIDPLPFYKDKVKDTTPPRARAVAFYPQAGKGIVNGGTEKRIVSVAAASGKSCLAKPVEAWGQIGVGIQAFDYMNGTNNNYGVRSVTLYVDDLKIYQSTVDAYLPEENRMINSWTDWGEYKKAGSWIMKSFVAPGNRLRMLHTGEDRGIVTINEERPYVFRYELADLYGNISAYTFAVQGKKRPVPEYRPRTKHELAWNRTNVVQEPGMELVIPRGMLYEDVALNCRVCKEDTNAVAFDYHIHDEPVPLHEGCELLIGVRNKIVADTSKYYIVRKVGKKKYSAAGSWQNGWIKTKIRELGVYTVEIDTIAPKIEPVGKAGWGKTGAVTYKMGDYGTGVKSYKGKIDGKFALFAYQAKNGYLTCKLDPRHVRKGIRHTLELVAEDYCGNRTLVEEQFTW